MINGTHLKTLKGPVLSGLVEDSESKKETV